eukprot:CAMPEP_0204271996 /NCGR_PEP_ID=MMETSP0468-20130131/21745_1 /ASSEMBLY_ACC=CAM_ASM_000383 /TAXON_ID=2969 /ORGANISM="Oxyrrhis marina" /LENGTH=323 /DNA_ID=CAMNT_0051247789 /DNA_START=64 /DNA_END=1035 /DNA_ORIENTATION=+
MKVFPLVAAVAAVAATVLPVEQTLPTTPESAKNRRAKKGSWELAVGAVAGPQALANHPEALIQEVTDEASDPHGAHGGAHGGGHGGGESEPAAARRPDFVLRACNSLTGFSAAKIEVFRGKRVTRMPAEVSYGECAEFPTKRLKNGDELEFRFKKVRATFKVKEIPPTTNTLLVVVSLSKASLTPRPSFVSHAFTSKAAQVIIVDSHTGGPVERPRLTMKKVNEYNAQTGAEELKAKEAAKPKDIQFSSVKTLEPGRYEFTLYVPDADAVTQKVSVGEGDKVVLDRIGKQGDELYPQTLMAFPSGAAASSLAAVLLVLGLYRD